MMDFTIKKINTVLLPLFVILFTVSKVPAQQRDPYVGMTPSQKQATESQLRVYQDKLNLSDEQVGMMRFMIGDFVREKQRIENTTIKDVDKVRRLKVLREEADKRIERLLDPSQIRVWLALRRKARMEMHDELEAQGRLPEFK